MKNKMPYFERDGQKYAYNATRLFELISKPNTGEIEDTQVTIQESIDSEAEIKMTKDIIETKNSINKDLMNIKYNFYKSCIDDLFDAGVNENGIPMEMSLDYLNVRQMIAFNTLVNEGIICVLED